MDGSASTNWIQHLQGKSKTIGTASTINVSPGSGAPREGGGSTPRGPRPDSRPSSRSGQLDRASKRLLSLFIAALLLLLALPVVTTAREVYVANMNGYGMAVFDTIGHEISRWDLPASGASGVAITPDGSRALFTLENDIRPGANFFQSSVAVVNTASGDVEERVNLAQAAVGVVITPDGSRAYIHGTGVDGTATFGIEMIGGMSGNAFSVAVTPDSSRAYITSRSAGKVSVLNTATGSEEASIPVPELPYSVAMTPDGSRAYVASAIRSYAPGPAVPGIVTVIDTDPASPTYNKVIGNPITVGKSPMAITITPDGSRAYVTNFSSDTVSVIDTTTNRVVGDPIPAGGTPFAIAITPDGSRAYVSNIHSLSYPQTITVIDTNPASPTYNRPTGDPIKVSLHPSGIAIVPNKTPTAQATVQPGHAGAPTVFDASDSSDPDGWVDQYEWNFGDGTSTVSTQPTVKHSYDKQGTYTATVTVVDDEGGKTNLVSDGQRIYHDGGGVAQKSLSFDVPSAPAVAGAPDACGKVLYENSLEVPREARLADLVDKGIKVRVSASRKSSGTLSVEITGREARHFKIFGKNSRVKNKTLAAKNVKLGGKTEDLYVVAQGKARRLIKRALRLKRAPKRTKLKVSLKTSAESNGRLKRLNTQTIRALRHGEVQQAETYTKVRRVLDRSLCGEPLQARIKGPGQAKLTSFVTSKRKPGRGITVKVSCSENCTATVGARMWGRYEVGLKLRRVGQRKNRLLVSRKVKLKAGQTKTVRLNGVSSVTARKLLVRGAKRKRYDRVKVKYIIEARTADGRSDSGSGTSRVRLRFK